MDEPRLPPELLARIIGHLTADEAAEEGAPRKCWFKSSSRSDRLRLELSPLLLVSKQFSNDLVRPEIYRNLCIFVDTETSDKLVKHLLNDCPQNLSLIQSVRLEWSRQSCPARYLPTRPKGRCARLSELLEALPNLRSLEIVFCDDQRHHVVQLELLLCRLVGGKASFSLECFSFNAFNEVIYKMRVRLIEELLLKHRYSLTALRLRGPWARGLIFSARPLAKLKMLRKLDLQDVGVQSWSTPKEEWEARCHAKHYKGWNSEDYGKDLLFDFTKTEEPEESKDEIEHAYRLFKPRMMSTQVSNKDAKPTLSAFRFGGCYLQLLANLLPNFPQAQKMSIALEKQDNIPPTLSLPDLNDLQSLQIRYYDCESEAMDDHPCPKPVGGNLTHLLELFSRTDAQRLSVAVSRAYDLASVTQVVLDLLGKSHWIFPRCQALELQLDCSEPAFVSQQQKALASARARLDQSVDHLRERGIAECSISTLSTRL